MDSVLSLCAVATSLHVDMQAEVLSAAVSITFNRVEGLFRAMRNEADGIGEPLLALSGNPLHVCCGRIFLG